MPTNVNRIRNPDLSLGGDAPRHWLWHTSSAAVQVERAAAGKAGLTIRHQDARGISRIEQPVACRAGKYYRVEADVTCELAGEGAEAGLFLTLRTADGAIDLRSAPLLRASELVAMRAYFETPKGATQVMVGVAVSEARGQAVVHQVRFITIIEPEEESHAMATPPPTLAMPTPRVVETVCICSAGGTDRPMVARLRAVLGNKKVAAIDGRAAVPAAADAVIFPDDVLPKSVKSLSALIALAEKKIVVVSLPAFAALSGKALSVRTVEQVDDPIHARVVFSNWATSGFALHDCFPFAWEGKAKGGFVQRQLRVSKEQKAFFRKHELTVLLDSMCDKDATSHIPIALFREFPRGALLVLDTQPVEATASTMNEPTIALQLMKSILGRSNPGLGQFTVPARTVTQFRQMLRDFSDRFPAFVVHDQRDPQRDDEMPVLVTVGGDDESFGLPLQPKPLILVRSGLISGEAESIYAALQWFKHFVRPLPHPCSYVDALAKRFRFGWVPIVAPWHVREGWSAGRFESGKSTNGTLNGRAGRHVAEVAGATEMALDLSDASVAALIDVTSTPGQIARVVVADAQGAHRRILEWVPKLKSLIFPAEVHAFAPSADVSFADRDSYAWRELGAEVEVTKNRSAFGESLHDDARRAGAAMVRIELPRSEGDFVTNSIHRTALGAALIEQVIGLVHGVVAVNRSAAAVSIAGLPKLAAGETQVLTDSDVSLSTRRPRALAT